MKTETIRIEGMSCGGCVASVKNAVGRLAVQETDVEIGKAVVTYDESKVTHQQIVEAIEDAGFDVVHQAPSV